MRNNMQLIREKNWVGEPAKQPYEECCRPFGWLDSVLTMILLSLQGKTSSLLWQVQNWLSIVKMIDEKLFPYGWKIHCSITDPQLKRVLHSWKSTIKWGEVNKGCLTFGKNENQGQDSRMIDYISCMINQKYIFVGGMLGGREGLRTSHHNHLLLLPVFYKLPQLNFCGIHVCLTVSAVSVAFSEGSAHRAHSSVQTKPLNKHLLVRSWSY